MLLHGKSTVVTIISKIRGISKKCTEFSLEIVSTVRVAIRTNGELRLLSDVIIN